MDTLQAEAHNQLQGKIVKKFNQGDKKEKGDQDSADRDSESDNDSGDSGVSISDDDESIDSEDDADWNIYQSMLTIDW